MKGLQLLPITEVQLGLLLLLDRILIRSTTDRLIDPLPVAVQIPEDQVGTQEVLRVHRVAM